MLHPESIEAVEPYERLYETQPARTTNFVVEPVDEELYPHALQHDPLDKYLTLEELEPDCG